MQNHTITLAKGNLILSWPESEWNAVSLTTIFLQWTLLIIPYVHFFIECPQYYLHRFVLIGHLTQININYNLDTLPHGTRDSLLDLQLISLLLSPPLNDLLCYQRNSKTHNHLFLEVTVMSDTLAFDTLSTALMCQTWRYSILILCYIYLGLIICYHMHIALSDWHHSSRWTLDIGPMLP